MKYILLILMSIMFSKSNNEIIVDELGYRLSVPNNYQNDRLRGGTYLWIKVDGTTKAGIQRWPNTFKYDDFRNEIKKFSNAFKGDMLKGDNPSEIHKTHNDQKTNYFKYLETEFYNFYIWSENMEILLTLVNGITVNDEILKSQFDKGIDYPIEGNEIIELANGKNIFFRDSVNIFQMNVDTNYFINPYLMISDGNLENRYQNIYSLSEIPNSVRKIKISINATDKTGEEQLNYRNEFEVK